MIDSSTIPLVLLPGLQSDARSWTNQISFFSGKRDTLVPEGYQYLESIPDMASHVVGQLPPRFHLVAWSMGGYITFHMLPIIADRLASLVLIATSATADNAHNIERRQTSMSLSRRGGMEKAATDSFENSILNADKIPAAIRSMVIQSKVDLGVDAYEGQQRAIINRKDSRATLRLISCPTLIIVGEQDRVTPPEKAMQIHRAIKGSQIERLDECGHCPPLEKPDAVNQMIEDWINGKQ